MFNISKNDAALVIIRGFFQKQNIFNNHKLLNGIIYNNNDNYNNNNNLIIIIINVVLGNPS